MRVLDDEDLALWVAGLDDLFALIADRFPRVEPRLQASAYVRGLLAPLASKNSWTLAEAAGNPLALVELPVTARQHDSRGGVTGWIPLTRRLEQAFASRLPGLRAVTCAALLAAGLNDGGS